MNIAIIPARGGSKRIPKKNIKDFFGKPMIVWSIEEARKSKLFDRIIVSTDDFEIAEISQKNGADVPFIRSTELSDDYVGTTEVVADAVEWAVDQGLRLEAICCIYATAPFMRHTDILRGLEILNSSKCTYAFSVTDFAAPIFRSFKENERGNIEMFFPEHFATRSQDLPFALHDAAQFYWGRQEAWIQRKKIFDVASKPVLIPRWRVQDIDTLEDWKRAEILAPAIFKSYF